MNNHKPPSRKKAAIIQAAFSYAGQVIAIVQGLVLIPLYISELGANLYGLWLASGGVLTWLGFVDVGLGAVVIQRISNSYSKQDIKHVGEYFSSGVLVFSIAAVLVMGLGYMISIPLPGWINAGESDVDIVRGCFQLAVLAMMFKLINDCLSGFAVALLRPLVPEIALVVWQILGLFSIVVLLLNGYGLWSLPIGYVVTQVGVFISNSYYVFVLLSGLKGTSLAIRISVLKDYFTLSPFLFAGRMGDSLSRNIEPTLIAAILTPEITTAYVVTRRAAELVWQILNVVLGATFAGFVHVFSEDNGEKTRKIALDILMFGFVGGVIGFGTYMATNSSFVSLWVGAEKQLSQNVITLIAMGMLFRVTQNYLIDLNTGAGNIAITSSIVFFESLMRVLGMYVLLKILGVEAAPLSMIISCGIFSLVHAHNLCRKIHLKLFSGSSWAKYILILAIVYFLSSVINSYMVNIDSWLGFVGSVVITIGIITIVFLSVRETKDFILKIVGLCAPAVTNRRF